MAITWDLVKFIKKSLGGKQDEVSSQNLEEEQTADTENENIDLKLRGHHISSFAANYFADSNEPDPIRDRYGPEFNKFSEDIYSSIIDKPSLKIEIVEGLDSLCLSTDPVCPKKQDSCSVDATDSYCLREYGLRVDGVYTAEEILQRVIEFKQRTDFNSPKDKLVDEMIYACDEF